MNKKIKIILADDHKMFLEGLYNLLNQHNEIHINGLAYNGKTVLHILKSHPDTQIIIMDISMPVMDGIALNNFIKRKKPKLKTIILSMYKDPLIIDKLIKNNIDGYLLKNTNIEELIDAIKTVSKGEKYFPEDIKKIYTDRVFGNKKSEREIIILSKREKEIMVLICREYTNNQIAEKLFISPYTVDTHRKNIMYKISAKNTAGIVKFAISNGLI